jgi:hypothetical protein
MAEPAAGSGLSRGVLRRAAGQDSRRRPGQEQGGLRCARLNSYDEKNVLGLWIEQTGGAKFCLKVVNELKARRQRHPDRRS